MSSHAPFKASAFDLYGLRPAPRGISLRVVVAHNSAALHNKSHMLRLFDIRQRAFVYGVYVGCSWYVRSLDDGAVLLNDRMSTSQEKLPHVSGLQKSF